MSRVDADIVSNRQSATLAASSREQMSPYAGQMKSNRCRNWGNLKQQAQYCCLCQIYIGQGIKPYCFKAGEWILYGHVCRMPEGRLKAVGNQEDPTELDWWYSDDGSGAAKDFKCTALMTETSGEAPTVWTDYCIKQEGDDSSLQVIRSHRDSSLKWGDHIDYICSKSLDCTGWSC